jgi:hypothetical protein
MKPKLIMSVEAGVSALAQHNLAESELGACHFLITVGTLQVLRNPDAEPIGGMARYPDEYRKIVAALLSAGPERLVNWQGCAYRNYILVR